MIATVQLVYCDSPHRYEALTAKLNGFNTDRTTQMQSNLAPCKITSRPHQDHNHSYMDQTCVHVESPTNLSPLPPSASAVNKTETDNKQQPCNNIPRPAGTNCGSSSLCPEGQRQLQHTHACMLPRATPRVHHTPNNTHTHAAPSNQPTQQPTHSHSHTPQHSRCTKQDI